MKLLLILLVLATLLILLGCYNSARYTNRVERTHPAQQFITVDGHKIHVLTQGDSGPVVLMIHGASANAREFHWTLAPPLRDQHRIIMMDRPGHGHSERPPNAHELAVQAKLAAGVLDALAPGEQAVIVGHSFGGAVALRLALDHPEKVASLVLLAPVSHDWGGGGQSWYNQAVTTPVAGELFNLLVPVLGPGQVGGGITSVFSPKPAPENYYERSGIGLLFRPKNFRSNARDVMALETELSRQKARYPDLRLPITVFSGALDTVISPKIHVGQLKYEAQNVTLVPLADGGHMPHHAFGAEVVDVIARDAARLR